MPVCSLHMRLCMRTNLQRGGQDAEAVQPIVELRVGGPSEERLPALQLAFVVRPATQGTHPALLARTKQVAQGGTLAAAFREKHQIAHLVTI